MVKLFLPSGPKKIQINPINNYYDIKIHEKLHLNKARITFSLFSEMEKGRSSSKPNCLDYKKVKLYYYVRNCGSYLC